MKTETLALTLVALITPVITEFFKRYPKLEKHRFWTAMATAFLLTFFASVMTAEVEPWNDPVGFTKNATLIMTVAMIIYRALIKDKPKVQRVMRLKRNLNG